MAEGSKSKKQKKAGVASAKSADNKIVKDSLELWVLLRYEMDGSDARNILQFQLKKIIEKHDVGKEYNILFLWTDDLNDFELGKIYLSLQELDAEKDTILIINSPGGSGEAAYLISKAIKDTCGDQKFIVAVPRKAKSAATLLSLGADEIHMSKIAELGPIDPQIDGFPALGTQHAFNDIVSLAEEHPGASEFLAKYLSKTLSPVTLGYTNRVAESAEQYAERLLETKKGKLPKGSSPSSIGHELVHEYKSHGFVIDYDEAAKLLGTNIVKKDTEIAKFAFTMHDYLDSAALALSANGHRLIISGLIDDLVVLGR